MGDGRVELCTGNQALKSKIGSNDGKWSKELKGRLYITVC